MRAKLKQKRIFQQQSRTTIQPETIPDDVYDNYKYEYYMDSHENIPTDPRRGIRSQYI